MALMHTNTHMGFIGCSGPNWVGLNDWMQRNVWPGVCQSVVLIDTTIHVWNRTRGLQLFQFCVSALGMPWSWTLKQYTAVSI